VSVSTKNIPTVAISFANKYVAEELFKMLNTSKTRTYDNTVNNCCSKVFVNRYISVLLRRSPMMHTIMYFPNIVRWFAFEVPSPGGYQHDGKKQEKQEKAVPCRKVTLE